jgi:hypothetical protein
MAKKEALVEIGKTGIVWSYGYVYDDFLTWLQGGRGIKIYREMSDNDSIIGACLFAIKQILREARWDVRPGDPEDAACKKDAKFLSDNIEQLTHSWSNFIVNVLSMLTYGWSYFEQVFRRADDGSIMWEKLAPRKQSSMEKWEIDDVGEVLGMWQRPAPSYNVCYLPLSKCLLFRTESAGNNPEGRSVLRNAYRAWYFKKNLEEIEGIGVERDLAGLPMLTPPEGFQLEGNDPDSQAAIAWAKKMISSLRRDEQDGIIVPRGWDFALVSSPGKRQFDTTEIINRYNKEIAVTVLAQFIMLGMERTGSYALAKEQTDMFYLCLEGWIDSIASTFNRHAVPTLFGLNRITGKMRPLPYMVHTNVRRFSLRDLAYYVNSLAGCEGLVMDEDIQKYLKNFARLSEFSEIKR